METLTVLRLLPAALTELAQTLSDTQARERIGEKFAVVEHAHHLADLEQEAFTIRIARLIGETDPVLSNFDGERNARERNYIAQSLKPAVLRFAEARAANLATLGALPNSAWARSGRQEGVGRVSLRDLPRLMAEHDADHASELVALLRHVAPGHGAVTVLEQLRSAVARGSAA